MIRVDARANEYLDREAVRDVEITVHVEVYARWREYTAEPPDRPLDPIPYSRRALQLPPGRMERRATDGGGGGWIYSQPIVLGPYRDRTGPDGRVAIDVPADAAFDELANTRGPDMTLPDEVVAGVNVDVRRLGLHRFIELSDWLARDGSVELPLILDFAKSSVGHVTETTARLWFCKHGPIGAGERYWCHVRRRGPGTTRMTPTRTIEVTLDPTRENSAVLLVDNLIPSAAYEYWLSVEAPGEPEPSVLCRGRFVTARDQPDRVTFAFASCHQPFHFERWEALERLDECDFLLMIGDTIYEFGLDTQRGSWLERYNSRYQFFLTPAPVRRVLRSLPVVSMWDDHEIADDWGSIVKPDTDEKLERFTQAQEAGRTFQFGKNLPGLGATSFDHAFSRGRVGFYLFDERSFRGQDAEHPILGSAQFERFQEWARRDAREFDVVFVISPVPIAFIPIPQILELIEEAHDLAAAVGGAIAGGIAGGVAGAAVGGPAGAFLGGAAGLVFGGMTGFFIGSEVLQRTDIVERVLGQEGYVEKYDLPDHWTHPDNQPELKAVLRELFDLANDEDRNPGTDPRPRAVFILGGDIHAGAVHRITLEEEAIVRRIFQLTSSPISNQPSNDEEFVNIVGHIQEGMSVFGVPALLAGDETRPARFHLDKAKPLSTSRIGVDPLQSDRYLSESQGLLIDRNFGTVSVEKIGAPEERRYRIRFGIEGDTGFIRKTLEVNLDARPFVEFLEIASEIEPAATV